RPYSGSPRAAGRSKSSDAQVPDWALLSAARRASLVSLRPHEGPGREAQEEDGPKQRAGGGAHGIAGEVGGDVGEGANGQTDAHHPDTDARLLRLEREPNGAERQNQDCQKQGYKPEEAR